MITADNITKIYKGDLYETKALDKVSFQIKDGEFVAVMGESGSGKSTLLNILGGMDTATEGSLYIAETDTQKLKQKRLDKMRKQNISFIFQYFALMDEYTVYQNIESPLIARNIKKAERKKRILEVLNRLGIDDLANKYPAQMSGGQQQRVAIARALVTGCPIILADEPTGALDEENTKNVMRIFQSIHEEGKTIILITHDKQVANYADRILHLKNGRLLQSECKTEDIFF